MKRQTLTFDIKTKDTLNSNRMPNHYIVKSNMASKIRMLGAIEGIKKHTDPLLSKQRYDKLIDEENVSIAKSRTKKKMNKEKCSPQDIEEALKKIEEDLSNDTKSCDIKAPYMFDKFIVTVTILSPTKRHVDPPNFYPTIKHLIDGLTYASWWKDDNFTQLLEMSFRYGGVSGKSDTYTFILDIEEVEDISKYSMGDNE